MKRCGRCGETKPIDAFGRRKRAVDGLHPWCKECVRDYCHARYARHREQIKAAAQEYRDRNREIVRVRDRERSLRDREKRAAQARVYYASNKTLLLAKYAQWSKDHRDLCRGYEQRYREANREKRREAGKRLYRETPTDKLRQKAVKSSQTRRARKRATAIVPFSLEALNQKMAYWGERCWICGIPMEAIDHVKPLSKGGPHVLANLRPICGKCNGVKGNKWPLSALFGRE